MTEVELIKGTIFEFDPNKKYMIILDKNHVTEDVIYQLAKAMKKMDFPNYITFTVDGSPAEVIEIMETE